MYIYDFLDSSSGKESICNAGDSSSISELGRSAEERIGYPLHYSWTSLVAQLVKNPPTMHETWGLFPGWEDPLEKGIHTHSSTQTLVYEEYSSPWESLGLQGNQPVNPKGNQSWIFTGRTDTADEALILWPLDAKNWLIRKDPDAGKDWRQEKRWMTKDEMVG